MKRTITAAVAVLTLGFAGLAGASAALADDLPIVDETATVAVEETPNESAKPGKPEVKLDPFCHSGNGTNYEWIHPANEGQLNGHQHHDADIFGGTEAECLALNTPPVEEPEPFVPYTVSARWLIPATWDYDTTPSYQAAIFPQAPLVGDVPACQWSQDDVYLLESPAEVALYESLDDDGFLTQGEDSSIYLSHVFTQGPKCEVPPVACVSNNAWGTEADDTAPVQTENGLVFTGGTGDAVGYGAALTGNLQGLGEITVNATGDLDVFYPRIVINSLADGGYSYDSLTVLSEGPVNGSSIAASNKRGFVQHTLNEWADLLPNNQLVAFFLHLDSGATAEQSVTVTGVTGDCLTLDVLPEPLPEDYTVPGETEWFGYDCDDTQELGEQQFTDYTYSRDEEFNVVETTTSRTEPVSRDLSAEEIAAKDLEEQCVVVEEPPTEEPPTEEPPTEEPPVTTPPTTEPPAQLVRAGTDPALLIGITAIGSILGLVLIGLRRRFA